jgi:H+/Na+-translocating ferredoxin:NAD+ oxidoreductase subunit C
MIQQEFYTILLKQHIGVAAEPVILVGDRVGKGQLIADIPKDSLGVPIHASVAGTVENITQEAIVIKADKEQSKEWQTLSGESPLELIKQAGIAGMGGAGFPTHVKLKTKLSANGCVIVNAAECEPILSHNIERILSDSLMVVKGLQYAMEVSGASKGIIAIKEKQKTAIEKLKEVINKTSNISLHLLPDIYPMGEERAVIREVTKTLLGVSQLPSEADVIVLNAETVYRIAEAVDYKKPVITKDITVAGRIQNEDVIQVIKDVPIGTLVGEILKSVGGCVEDYGEIILGGPFTGKRASLDDPITKTSGGIIAAMPFLKEKRKLGLLVCACGCSEERMKEIANSMEAEVAGVAYCKQAVQIKNSYKCENPGKCPGQTQKVLELKKEGAQALLIGNCTDCTNTVMSIAPKLQIPVYHITDGALRAVSMKLIRKVHLTEK